MKSDFWHSFDWKNCVTIGEKIGCRKKVLQTNYNYKQRIVSLDVLRGFALLGILLMNIQSFAMPSAAYINPFAFGDLQGGNMAVWLMSHVLADQKFMAIFSMLFGAGVLVFCSGLESKGIKPAYTHYRRTFWLLVFGLIHGYLFWYADILFTYALCALVLFLFRGLSAPILLSLAFLFFLTGSLLYVDTGLSLLHAPQAAIAGVMHSWQPDQLSVQNEIAAYTGTWMEAFRFRLEETYFMQSYVFSHSLGWRAMAMMLLGMALYKWNFFTLAHSKGYYLRFVLWTVPPGLILVGAGLLWNFHYDFTLQYSMFLGSQFNYWGSLFIALAYASLVMLWVKCQWQLALQSRLAAVGRMAFSNYILHTLICTTLFYQLAWFGSVSRLEQGFIVLAIWMLQMWVSPLWLKYFRFGPLEWLWRSLTYGNMAVLKRG
jgi:uncharacterized protein